MPVYPPINVFAFDLDGTIYKGNTIIDGAAEVINYINNLGIQIVYFTNSSTRTREQIVDKLGGMGLVTSLNKVYTSAYATAVYANEKSYSKVWCIGTAGLNSEIETFGIQIAEDISLAEALIIGLDPEFDYNKLAEIMPFRSSDCPIIACNRDRSYPVENGRFLPGCGPIVAAVEDALGRKVDCVTGKPSTYMLGLLTSDWNYINSDIIVVGDSYDSDIQMANSYGCRSFLISSSMNHCTDGTTIVQNIGDIIQYLT
ncbi:MAG: HAD-IIA family hydrolase [Desulfuromonadaceae bacterium]|nr:HAD-IIA family hydrolase [Desulfuromonadaceae bacterium]